MMLWYFNRHRQDEFESAKIQWSRETKNNDTKLPKMKTSSVMLKHCNPDPWPTKPFNPDSYQGQNSGCHFSVHYLT